ncbi:MAG: peptidoglycan-binding protein [Tessaracoccus sp.]|uniref:peptidoglycan-binding domain-containing protein n=1 Tax=Tessaracoccus sp. TaxID=1971211 RepID=UPI001EC31DCB|nr:peptidoglycan-binding domain-containing protein [Tessaracoccus sp.]MBK7821126.1 peptidoglycan-binding protein [Tessaracoccus sp.]
MTLVPPIPVTVATDDQISVTVTERTIGQTLDYGVQTSRESRPIATNTLAGVVVVAPDNAVAERKVGDVLYAVGGVPVRVVEGGVPFSRDLEKGLTGKDVAQLERALVALGYLTAADEDFDEATADAVSDWQRKLGMQVTGTVKLGELVAAPTLPAHIGVDDKAVWAGAVLTGGEVLVTAATGTPQFVLPLSPGQLSLVPADATMTVEAFGRTWPAQWESSRPNDETGAGELVTLSSPEGGAVCGEECALIPAEKAWATVHIEVIPRTTGPTVPLSAVSTDAVGKAWVMVTDGDESERRAVTVVRSHAGLAVVEGVAVGEAVLALPAQEPSTPSPAPAASETP